MCRLIFQFKYLESFLKSPAITCYFSTVEMWIIRYTETTERGVGMAYWPIVHISTTKFVNCELPLTLIIGFLLVKKCNHCWPGVCSSLQYVVLPPNPLSDSHSGSRTGGAKGSSPQPRLWINLKVASLVFWHVFFLTFPITFLGYMGPLLQEKPYWKHWFVLVF